MPRIEETIDIAVARADVFRFCHYIKNRTGWDEQVEFMELLTPKPFRQGTLLRVDAKAGGSVFSWDAEVISYQMPSTSKVRVIDAALTCPFAPGSELSWEFIPVGSGTRLKWVWDYKPYGFIAGILDKLGRRASTQKAIKRSLAKLKAALESGRRAGIN
jgi:hypothetical protein